MNALPDLTIDHWRATRDTLHQCSQLMSDLRSAAAPKRKHWFHIALKCGVRGVTTGPLFCAGHRFLLELDFANGEIILRTEDLHAWRLPFAGASMADLEAQILGRLKDAGIPIELNRSDPMPTEPLVFNAGHGASYWSALSRIDHVFQTFRGTLREETGDVLVWAHHFDLAMLWFNGKRVPDMDPADEENADVQMNFGFIPGDSTTPEPYFYITAYPFPERLRETALPTGASWNAQGFNGVVYPYAKWRISPQPEQVLLTLLCSVRRAGEALL